ncbi:TldD/PmbA family protein [Candidatus Woesearchaeota archaeon]|jgi:PmbA protein|nr:TldD/PmbA family protein [Candidatus Woesearchaeota archaeon]MBT4114189.1 TldD/PmbA family protein [Candidatus Woesearchaeota archaeon]MBT4248257.1 TldD/PmbA family protein [Candidatus Woesearchaeota archaeon]
MKLFEIPEYGVKKALRLGASDVIVDAGRSDSQQIKFVNNDIAVTKNWQDESAGVYLVYKKRVVSANIKTFTKSEVDHTLNKLIKLAKLLPPKDDYYGIAKGYSKYPKLDGVYDRQLVNFTKGVDKVQEAINAGLRSGAKRVTGVFDTSYGEGYTVSSNGLDIKDKGTAISLSLRALAAKEASGHKVIQANVLRGFDVDRVGSEAGKIAKKALNPQSLSAGKYDILFYPLTVADMFGCVAGSSSITMQESGMSFLKKIGEKVASPKLTMYDWANLPYGADSYAFDDEGAPAQKTPVIVNGVFKTYLHNYSTAQKYKTQNTSNSGLVEPAPSNTYIVPGKSSIPTLIGKMKKGLIVTNTWYTTFQNYQTGNFSTIPRDAIFYVENGKIKCPVKDIRISDNMLNIMRSITDLGKKQEQVTSWAAEPPNFGNNIITPAILCKKLNVTKSRS